MDGGATLVIIRVDLACACRNTFQRAGDEKG